MSLSCGDMARVAFSRKPRSSEADATLNAKVGQQSQRLRF